MPRLTNAQLIKTVAAQLGDPVRTGTPVGFGNQPAGTQFFSRRVDVKPHFHKPGNYYCGRCMKQVAI